VAKYKTMLKFQQTVLLEMEIESENISEALDFAIKTVNDCNSCAVKNTNVSLLSIENK
jgi:hypothetical protein